MNVLLCALPGLLSASVFAQAAAPPPASSPAQASAISDPSAVLRPALEQVAAAVQQIRVDHWKVSKDWKHQLQGDIDSIQQDLSGQLPQLIQSSHASPTQMAPQMAVMQNVDALYDVLVRITTAASLGGNKANSVTLQDALRELETARKSASGQLQQEASLRDQQLAKLQAVVQANSIGVAKTVVVNNGKYTARRRKILHHKKVHAAGSQNSTGTPPAAQQPHP